MLGWLSLFTGLMPLSYAIFYGRTARRVRLGLPTREKDAIGMHRALHLVTVTFVAIGVIGMLIAVRKVGGLWGNPTFITFHITLACVMITAFMYAVCFRTGIKSPETHWRFAYTFVGSYLATLATGTVLLVEKFPGFRWMYSIITFGVL